MRVICINGVKINERGELHITKETVRANIEDLIYEGQPYEVIGVITIDGKSYYRLAGKPYFNAYYANRFVLLSGIDECELVNTKEEVYG